jgi:hypothetical protein
MITTQQLFRNLQLKENISDFFLHRSVPYLNEYWATRPEYISPSPGYLFIPIYFDLLTRKGIPAPVLFSDHHMDALEKILDSVARFERHQFGYEAHLENCRKILLQQGVSPEKVRAIESQLVFKPSNSIPIHFQALGRADTFLYATAITSDNYSLLRNTWESFMPLLLFLDDVEDLRKDSETGDENCLLQGKTKEDSFFQLHPILQELLNPVAGINPGIFNHLNSLRVEALKKGMIEISLLG